MYWKVWVVGWPRLHDILAAKGDWMVPIKEMVFLDIVSMYHVLAVETESYFHEEIANSPVFFYWNRDASYETDHMKVEAIVPVGLRH